MKEIFPVFDSSKIPDGKPPLISDLDRQPHDIPENSVASPEIQPIKEEVSPIEVRQLISSIDLSEAVITPSAISEDQASYEDIDEYINPDMWRGSFFDRLKSRARSFGLILGLFPEEVPLLQTPNYQLQK
jgi:hypothetical protein